MHGQEEGPHISLSPPSPPSPFQQDKWAKAHMKALGGQEGMDANLFLGMGDYLHTEVYLS